LAGYNDRYGSHGAVNTIVNCYSAGSVTGSGTIGGLIGIEAGSVASVLSDNFWDYEAAGLSSTQDIGNKGDVSGITGKAASEMKQESTFFGWDFTSTWKMVQAEDYPILQWSYTPPPSPAPIPDGPEIPTGAQIEQAEKVLNETPIPVDQILGYDLGKFMSKAFDLGIYIKENFVNLNNADPDLHGNYPRS
jgi:hypothetical protein